MTHNRWIVPALLAFTGLAALWAYSELDANYDRAVTASQNLTRVAALDAKLHAARPAAQGPVSRNRIDNIPRLMADAGEAVGIFDRMSSRAISDRPVPGSTGLLESGQQVSLRAVTIQKAVEFMRQVSELQPALRTVDATFEPSAKSDTEQWNVEAAITYVRSVAPAGEARTVKAEGP